jgi:hypothetical protein
LSEQSSPSTNSLLGNVVRWQDCFFWVLSFESFLRKKFGYSYSSPLLSYYIYISLAEIISCMLYLLIGVFKIFLAIYWQCWNRRYKSQY